MEAAERLAMVSVDRGQSAVVPTVLTGMAGLLQMWGGGAARRSGSVACGYAAVRSATMPLAFSLRATR